MVGVDNKRHINAGRRQVGALFRAQHRLDIANLVLGNARCHEVQHLGLDINRIDLAPGHSLGHGEGEVAGTRANVGDNGIAGYR